MGGEQVIGAAAADTRIRAVVGEGVTGRGFADKGLAPPALARLGSAGIDATLYGTADLLTDASPPISLRDAVAAAAPTPVLLIAGGATMGNARRGRPTGGSRPAHRAPSTCGSCQAPGTQPRCGLSPRNGEPRSSDSSTTNSCSNDPGDTPRRPAGVEQSLEAPPLWRSSGNGVTPGWSCGVSVDHDIDAAVERTATAPSSG